MKREEALEVFKVEMKKRGYKKYSNTWYKKLDDIYDAFLSCISGMAFLYFYPYL